jgi:hypothetical protein
VIGVDMIGVGEPLPRIAACRALPDFGLEVMWTEGGIDIVDVYPALETRRMFEHLRSSEQVFSNCAVGEDGACVAWPDGSELSAVWIARLAEETSPSRQSVGMTSATSSIIA